MFEVLFHVNLFDKYCAQAGYMEETGLWSR